MTVLDLLSAVGSMPISGDGSFKDAVQAITGQNKIFSHRRALEGLGHARTEHGERRVYVLSPRLISLPRKDEAVCAAVLSGARSAEIVSELNYLASSNRSTIETKELGDGIPPKITIRGPAASLKEIAHRCNSLPLEISDDPTTPDAWRLLSSVPTLQSIIRGFIEETIGIARGEPPTSAEVFNPGNGYYNRWSSLREGYQSSYALWRKSAYDFRLAWRQLSPNEGEDSIWMQKLSPVELDPLWIRWAAAYSANPHHALPSISPQGTYRVNETTPLPMELHQVCCLCSGLPPVEGDGFHIYQDVPPIIQQGVTDRLKAKNP